MGLSIFDSQRGTSDVKNGKWTIVSRKRLRLAAAIALLEQCYPGIGSQIEVVDVAWAPPGGVPAVATWARQLIQILCRKDGQSFVTTLPAGEQATPA